MKAVAIAIIDYDISVNRDHHLISSDDLADMIEDIMLAVKSDNKNDTNVFTAKYVRLISDLRKV